MRNLMTPSDKLDLYISEYLKETDKKRIENISIFIPGHNGHFWIIDGSRLTFNLATLSFKTAETFSLAIYFSFADKSKKGKSITDKISMSGCFSDFTSQTDSRSLSYIKDKYFDKTEIIKQIEYIIVSLFPNIEYNDVIIDLKRRDNWMTIEEKGSA